MPASMEPLMAMAPTQKSAEALTKPSTKRLLPSPRTSRRRSSSPIPSIRFSMLMASPSRVPTTMHTMTHRLSAVAIMLVTPMPSTHRPRAKVRPEAKRALMRFLNTSPNTLPRTIRTTLITVAIMASPAFTLQCVNSAMIPLFFPFVNGRRMADNPWGIQW